MKAQDYKDIKINDAGTQKVIGQKEIIWQKKSLGPGPTKLIGGNEEAGFYGEVPTSELITGDELARMLGLTAGKSQNSNGGWLKFSYLGKTEFIAKKTFRHSISWNNINAVNAVFGNRTIKVGEHTYKIRLIKGKTEGRQDDISSRSGAINHNSEWNKLMLPIHKNAPSNWAYKDNVSYPTENWSVGYTDNDLFTHYNAGYGSFSLCQEYGEKAIYRLVRGGRGVSSSGSDSPSFDGGNFGWRPVLELVD